MQILDARKGIVTQEVKAVAEREGVSAEFVRERVADGRIALAGSGEKLLGVGEGLRTKVNANLGMSPDSADEDAELHKLHAAIDAGADTVMDLSIAGDADGLLKRVARTSTIPVGSVPVYSAVLAGKKKGAGPADLDEDEFLKAVERHAKLADFVTVHAAISRDGALLAGKRLMKVVSRGGCFLTAWMLKSGKENPYITHFDSVVEMMKERDTILSLGDALRPGCLADANDEAQLSELRVQGELVKRALAAGVQVICEGPGHMRLDLVAENVRMQKRLCSNVPYYVLGPLATDIAVGYDHIAGGIGGAIASAAGADFLCVVTPSEHAALPDAQDIREGVIAARIAAHAGDLVKRKDTGATDLRMSEARAALDWKRQGELALDGGRKLGEYRKKRGSASEACSMCGEYCAYKISAQALRTKKEGKG